MHCSDNKHTQVSRYSETVEHEGGRGRDDEHVHNEEMRSVCVVSEIRALGRSVDTMEWNKTGDNSAETLFYEDSINPCRQ